MRAQAMMPRGKLCCLIRMPCGGYKSASPNLSGRSDFMRAVASMADRELHVEDIYALARRDFATFVELAFPILHPGKTLVHAPYLDVLVALMEDCAAGRKPRVIVNLPPGYMKSMLISIMYIAWRLGVDPTLKFVCISYGDDLAHKHSASTRTLMRSAEYRAIFP